MNLRYILIGCFPALLLTQASGHSEHSTESDPGDCDLIWHHSLAREGELVLKGDRVVDPESDTFVTGLLVLGEHALEPRLFSELVDGIETGVNFLIGENGRLRDFLFIEKGEPHGDFYRFHRNGMIEVRGRWADGKRVGAYMIFSDSGTTKNRKTYSGKGLSAQATDLLHLNQVRVIEKKRFESVGDGEAVTGIIIGPDWDEPEFVADVRNGILHGGRFRHRADGSILEIAFFRHGKKHGPYLSFHENRMVSSRGRYEDGDKVGVWTDYDSDGLCLLTTEYPTSVDAEEREGKPEQTGRGNE